MKKFLAIIYAVFVVILTFALVPVFKGKGANDFLQNNQELIEASDHDIIFSTIMAYKNDGSRAYVKKDPLFSENYSFYEESKLKYNFNLRFYNLIIKNKKVYTEALAIIIDDLVIDAPLLTMNDEGNYSVFMELNFSDKITVNKKEISKSSEVFYPLYDGVSGILVFDLDIFKTNNGRAEINKINILANRESTNDLNMLTLVNDLYDGDVEDDEFEDVSRNLDFIKSENMLFIDEVDTSSLDENDSYYFSKGLSSIFKNKYNYFLYFVLIWSLVIFVLTYFIFFNKYVILFIKDRKRKKDKEFEFLKENIKKENFK